LLKKSNVLSDGSILQQEDASFETMHYPAELRFIHENSKK